MPKLVTKTVLHGFFLLVTLPAALLAGFGRWESLFSIFAHTYALFPGLLGDYFRIAYYKWTLAQCSLDSRVQFGSFFAHSEARIGKHVYIGSYCILGKVFIGDRAQIASGVQILSGRHQHLRDESGRILGAEEGVFAPVMLGAHCWIGAGSIVMADVGEGCTIGAGSVVTKPIAPGSVAMGSPAKVISTTVNAG